MKYNDDEAVMNALGITSWRNLSRDKVLALAAMMPDIDKEVSLKLIEKVPEFMDLAGRFVDQLENRHHESLARNAESQQRVHDAWQEVRDVLAGELDRELTPEMRARVHELLIETAHRESEKDSENKKYLERMFKVAAFAGGVALASVVVFVGGKVYVQNSSPGAGPNIRI